MNYPSIRIKGAILSPDILGQSETLAGQKPADFDLKTGTKVKDEISYSWGEALNYWLSFQRKLDTVNEASKATTETRNLWIVPLMSLLHYNLEYQSRGKDVNGQNYAISHCAINRADTPVQIIGANDPAGLDKKPTDASRRMSAHALVQEFLNLNDQLYGFVTNGHVLRLLRDNTRLVEQSYLEFDLDRIFSDGLYADFAILYRLLHATRLSPQPTADEILIERYHQDSLDQGARIRERLSKAVEKAVRDFGNGFLAHPDNGTLCAAINHNELSASDYYQQLLRLIYRLLFLMVIEARDLVFPDTNNRQQRDIYRRCYSVTRLCRLSEKCYLKDPQHRDLWSVLQACFSLFEAGGPGAKLGIAPLAGDLFSAEAMGALANCSLCNKVLLKCLYSLSCYRHPDSNQRIRVNYADLNVEEFGSVYEGLLEYEPTFHGEGNALQFQLQQGSERATTGSHYTPDDLVQPLIQHSLDHLIAERLKADDPKAALLDLRIADITCGSGHILLAAARRIATKLATVRTGEEQPSPSNYRSALRDVIGHCIYGVDVNPLAVELCKVALWLEAHIPGQPLNFLDHHIKCGNAIVGVARHEELDHGVPTEAFKQNKNDDKKTAATYCKQNQKERESQTQRSLGFSPKRRARLVKAISEEWQSLEARPEQTPAQIDAKKQAFTAFTQGEHATLLQTIANIPVAQFYIPKQPGDEAKLITDAEFRRYWNGELAPQGLGSKTACSVGREQRFFHWFLEFPAIMAQGGFDCILGNPPYLGGQALSGNYDYPFCEYMKWQFAPTGLSELVVFFLRRIHGLLRNGGFTSIITTNSIIDGRIRKDGLKQIIATGTQINMAERNVTWPGAANLVVSLLAMHKGEWKGSILLDKQPAKRINSFFEEGEEDPDPHSLAENQNRMFQGTIFLGNGFLLSHEEANRLRETDPRNAEVLMPIINGKELNREPNQVPERHIINFFDWPLERAQRYSEPFAIVEGKVKPFRATKNIQRRRDLWWIHASRQPSMTRELRDLSRCFVTARTTKYLSFSSLPTNYVFSDALNVFTSERWDLFAVIQSTLHEVWGRKYSGTLTQRLRYSPADCFRNFAFPTNLWQTDNTDLAQLGENYHEHRKQLMQCLWLGLTDLYNLFHDPKLSHEMVAKVSGKDNDTAKAGHKALQELRELHIELDIAVHDAYGWDIDLEHGFHEIETLPENDRVRYTISPAARREVLKRLLAENHTRFEKEQQANTPNT